MKRSSRISFRACMNNSLDLNQNVPHIHITNQWFRFLGSTTPWLAKMYNPIPQTYGIVTACLLMHWWRFPNLRLIEHCWIREPTKRSHRSAFAVGQGFENLTMNMREDRTLHNERLRRWSTRLLEANESLHVWICKLEYMTVIAEISRPQTNTSDFQPSLIRPECTSKRCKYQVAEEPRDSMAPE